MNKFIESAKRERFSLECILPYMTQNKDYEWKHNMTKANGYDVYDCILEGSIDGKVVKRFIIEMKLRTGDFSTLVLEKKKLLSMRSVASYYDEAKLLYINVTTSGTYVFDITNIDGKVEVTHLYCNKATAISSTNKVDKEVYMLPLDIAVRRFDFKFNEQAYQTNLKLK